MINIIIIIIIINNKLNNGLIITKLCHMPVILCLISTRPGLLVITVLAGNKKKKNLSLKVEVSAD